MLKILQHFEDEEGNLTKKVEIQQPVHKYPAVFRWTGVGEEVAIAGSFNSWRAKIPLVKRLADKQLMYFLSDFSHSQTVIFHQVMM